MKITTIGKPIEFQDKYIDVELLKNLVERENDRLNTYLNGLCSPSRASYYLNDLVFSGICKPNKKKK